MHLGLFGRFREHRAPTPPPRLTARLRLEHAAAALDLSGPSACELIDPLGRERILARLGPDPLRADADPAAFAAALARRRLPVGAALLDQSLVAGLGNVYRAEVMFLCGIAPTREARSLSVAEAACLWHTMSRLLRDDERLGRIVTVDAAEPAPRRAARAGASARMCTGARAAGAARATWPPR